MRKNPAVRSLLYAGDLLAVDLGTYAIKLLHVKAGVRSLTILGSARREVWRALAEAKSEEEKVDVYAAALRETIAASGIKTRNASISLSGNVVVIRFLPLPPGYKLDRDTGLPPAAQALIPFDEADADVSTVVVDADSKDKAASREMILVAARKAIVQGGMNVARMAGLRPAVIMNDILAVGGAYEFFMGKKAEETIALVNAGASFTSVSIIEDGILRAARVFNIAGNVFTRAVKREFSVEFDEAETLKREHGLKAPEGMPVAVDAVAAQVARALKPPVKDLSAEIQRTIDAFHARRPADERPVTRVLLAGGSSQLKGLAETLFAELGIPVDEFRPMVNIPGKNGVLGIAPLSGDLSAACGLGLSNALLRRSLDSRINLVPKRARRSAIIRDISPGFWKMLAGPALVVAALALYGVWAVRVSHHEAALEKTLELTSKRENELRKKMAKKNAVPVKHIVDPYAFLSRLSVSGVFGNGRSALVMLDAGGAAYTARGGKLFDSNEAEIRGVASEIRDNSLALTAGGRRYAIPIPK